MVTETRFDRLENTQDRIEQKIDDLIESKSIIQIEFEKRVGKLEFEINQIENISDKLDLVLNEQLKVSTMLTVHDQLHKQNSKDLAHHIARTDALTEIVAANKEQLQKEIQPLKAVHDKGHFLAKMIAGVFAVVVALGGLWLSLKK
jgi:hypothetical protein